MLYTLLISSCAVCGGNLGRPAGNSHFAPLSLSLNRRFLFSATQVYYTYYRNGRFVSSWKLTHNSFAFHYSLFTFARQVCLFTIYLVDARSSGFLPLSYPAAAAVNLGYTSRQRSRWPRGTLRHSHNNNI